VLHVFCNTDHVDIYVFNSYLLLSTTLYKYIVGLADVDLKLFVNKVRGEPLFADLENVVKKDGRLIRIYRSSDDREVWSILGYDFDVATREKITVDKLGVYRVQGDLALEVDEYKPPNLLISLSDAQRRLLADLIVRVLAEMRVTVRVDTEDNIIVPIMVPVKDPKVAIKHSDAIRDMVIERVATTLYEKLKELGLATRLNPLLSWRAIIKADNEYRNCDIHISDGGFTHGYDTIPYVRMNVIISPRCGLGASEGTLLEKMYKDLLQLYQPRTFEFTIGNHHIRIENALSLNIRYRPRWQPLLLGDLIVEISVDQGWYRVTPDSTITITHDEHGMTTVRFAGVYRARFRTLNLDETHTHERNAIAFNLIPTY
jgi:hypothetical protein